MKYQSKGKLLSDFDAIQSRIRRVNKNTKQRLTLFILPYFILAFPNTATAQTPNPIKITVNSNQDEIKPDENLTLREAIALTNGTLSINKLSESEKALIQPASENSQIQFNLPTGQTTIELTQNLPAVVSPGVVIDGTTQPGYGAIQPANAQDYVPALPTRPVVVITPATGKEVFRGLSVFADAAVYLMGNDHKVINNRITNQAGSGVVVTAFPPSGSFTNGASIRNMIQHNSFAKIEGLSIDLNTRGNVDLQNFQRGDGKNPRRNTKNRRLDTGNAAIDSPKFLANEFLNINGKTYVDGTAEPGSEIEIYKVTDGALNQVITSVIADDKGRFGAILDNLQPGELISATATNPKYGTSEPAYSAVVKSTNREQTASKIPATPSAENPNCTTPKTSPKPDLAVAVPETIRLRVPNNIHYALDQDFISIESQKVLDQIFAVLQQYPSFVIELQGHTDSRASDTYSQDLGLRRARNARNYLIKKGIAPERMTIRSFGERKLQPGQDQIEHTYNRRVEVMFFDVQGVEIILESHDG